MRGLSPLARGTLKIRNKKDIDARFIPAGAGNTQHGIFDRTNFPVYPRWRGEHGINLLCFFCAAGLSPLARGTHPCLVMAVKILRFIPAGAGNTVSAISSRVNSPVYPRWRGEHQYAQRSTRITGGLSPLARGTHTRRIGVQSFVRFIPAGAGNTRSNRTGVI